MFDGNAAAVYRTILAYTGGRADVAEESVAEAFARAAARWGELRDPVAWLYRVAFNVATDELRRERRPRDGRSQAVPPPSEPGELFDVMRRLPPRTTEGAPGDALTIDGPMPFRHEDGSFDRSGDAQMIAWWNASPADAGLLSSFSNVGPSPAEEGPLLRLGEGDRGACSFSIGFTVPDVPPGDYPIVVLQEAGGGSTMEAALTFTIR